MWLSRAGVIEQAVSDGAPTITSATISSDTPSTVNFVTSQNCTYTDTTGITVTTNAPAAVTVTAVSGTDTAGAVTLSRNILGGEIVKLIFAATNGVTSQATGAPIQAVTFTVTNNAGAASTPQFQTFTWSSASAGTSVISDGNGAGAIFPNQATGLAVQFPNWVGYSTAGAAVTDTAIKVTAEGFWRGFAAGNSLTGFNCWLVTNQTAGAGPGFQDSGTPYFVGGSSPTRNIGLSAPQLALIGLPTVSGKGVVEFDILSLLSTALGTPITLEYTDAIPASNTVVGTGNGTQTSSFFLRVVINGVDESGQPWAQELDVRTSEQNPYDGIGNGNLSGPITATPTLISVRLCELNNPNNVVGQVATAANGWNLGTITSADWNSLGGATYDVAQLTAVFQANSYVYNNPIAAAVNPGGEPTSLIFTQVNFQFSNDVITFDGGQILAQLDDSNPPTFVTQPQPASVLLPAGGGAVDGGFSFRVNPTFTDDPLLTTRTLDGSPAGSYPFQLNILSDLGVSINAYSYQTIGEVTQDNTSIAAAPGITVSGTYQVL